MAAELKLRIRPRLRPIVDAIDEVSFPVDVCVFSSKDGGQRRPCFVFVPQAVRARAGDRVLCFPSVLCAISDEPVFDAVNLPRGERLDLPFSLLRASCE